jgi:starch synthase (maltosyl-transferring)
VAAPPHRIQLQYPQPTVDGGRYPAKRCAGDTVRVAIDAFRDGHEKLRVAVRYRRSGERRWREAPLHAVDDHVNGVRWEGEFAVDAMGSWQFTFTAWVDRWATWRHEIERKVEAGQVDLGGELSEGEVLLRETLARAKNAPAIERALTDFTPAAALDLELHAAMEANPERYDETTYAPVLALEVDRLRARFGAWYELFPRSWGGLRGTREILPELRELGFDVLYLPPIHPIGERNRKGRNNTLVAAPGDPGSPWAIGHHAQGGHDAIHPDLGTEEDFLALTRSAAELGIDVGLDLAIQCSADHPWLTEHPEWFHHRPDGSLKYAENPPKRYQDIYNVNWDCEDWQGLWNALREITIGWVRRGVKVFRVDNPHTKPFPFWEWLIAEVHAVDRDVIFLAEAFTRRAVMRQLAKIGFTQSYTYFTWKNARWELQEYLGELAQGPEREYFRPNFFTNTPDILHEYLVHGGPPAFVTRATLAATLSPTYGIYSGFEHFENVPVSPGSEEYLDSEKYEIKQRALDGPLLPFLRDLNRIRNEHPALQRLDNLTFLETHNEALIAFAKQEGDDTVIVVCNLDAQHAQEGAAVVPFHLGLPPAFTVRELLAGEEYSWRIGPNFVRLSPDWRQVHVLGVER